MDNQPLNGTNTEKSK